MPSPPLVIIGVGVLATVAVGIVIKEFIYEPFVAPVLEEWAEQFMQHRRDQRRYESPYGAEGPDNADDDDDRRLGGSVELENLVANEQKEWRGRASSPFGEGSEMRQRRTAAVLSNTKIDADTAERYNPFMPPPMKPTHVLFDSSSGISTADQSPLRSRATSPTPVTSPSLPVRAATGRAASSIATVSVKAESPVRAQIRLDSPPIIAAAGRAPSTSSTTVSPSASAYGAASRSAFASPVMRTVSPPTARNVNPAQPLASDPTLRQWQAEVALHEPLGSPSAVPSTLGSPPPRVRSAANLEPSVLGLMSPPMMPRSPFSDAMSSTWSDVDHAEVRSVGGHPTTTTQDEVRSLGHSASSSGGTLSSSGIDEDDIEVLSGAGSWESVGDDDARSAR